MGIPASKRLRKKGDFLKVRDQGFRLYCGPFIYQCRLFPAHAESKRRFGVIASRRVGNAVTRNKGKRVFREIFRKNEIQLPANCDVVIILRSSFRDYSYAELEAEFTRACKNAATRIDA
ncbi:MAG: ribonuclease P protein component [Verrucomicrobiota bacterium]